jgi:putative heme degradation protein
MNGINLIKEYLRDQKEIVIFCGVRTSVKFHIGAMRKTQKSWLTHVNHDFCIIH